MENVKKCRYHLLMFNRYRMVTLFLIALVTIRIATRLFSIYAGLGSSVRDVAMLVLLLGVTAFAFHRLNDHARHFEELIGIEIEKELLSNLQTNKAWKRVFRRVWIHLFDYYQLADQSYESYENIKESA